ncbi:MAG TPA: MarR family transcriptional regulator [Rhodospirillaceae bacterium]|nr:MarR family transcriptional regulator [Rhodospirillaceae bacterium]
MTESEKPSDGILALRVWLALFSSVKEIESVVQKNLRGAFSSTLPRFDLLAQLYRHSEGLTMGELSNRLMVTNGNVTGLIGRLVGEGLVDRTVDSEDRRIQRVKLSDKGRQLFDSMAPANQVWIGQAMAGMSERDLQQLHKLLLKLKASTKEFAPEFPPGDS